MKTCQGIGRCDDGFLVGMTHVGVAYVVARDGTALVGKARVGTALVGKARVGTARLIVVGLTRVGTALVDFGN